ncbi:MAG: hypothetical protein D6798_20960 [Deltaproteobacteria bacterium]|nr:MAG: hypothetical protein D6798_20960 [Deltaproteobacteria bacterium]
MLVEVVAPPHRPLAGAALHRGSTGQGADGLAFGCRQVPVAGQRAAAVGPGGGRGGPGAAAARGGGGGGRDLLASFRPRPGGGDPVAAGDEGQQGEEGEGRHGRSYRKV